MRLIAAKLLSIPVAVLEIESLLVFLVPLLEIDAIACCIAV